MSHSVMRRALVDAALTFDGRPVPIGQVVLAAVSRGEWAELEREVASSLACLSVRGELPGDDDLRSRLVAWRRERQLLSAEDYHAWLADRGLTLTDMSEHLRCAAVAEQATASSEAAGMEPVGDDIRRFEGILYREAILGGRLSAWAQRLAQQQAARRALSSRATELPPPPPEDVTVLVAAAIHAKASGLSEIRVEDLRDWAAEVVTLEQAWRLLADQLDDPALIERCFGAHNFDWQRLEWEEATFARDDVAREVRIWVREEGLSLAAVAERAGASASVNSAYGDDAGELADRLNGKRPGELIGPMATGSGWRLVQLRERVPPTAANPELRARAIAELLEDALAPHLAGRVEWRARL